jgi:hypothetical protein
MTSCEPADTIYLFHQHKGFIITKRNPTIGNLPLFKGKIPVNWKRASLRELLRSVNAKRISTKEFSKQAVLIAFSLKN